MANQTDPYSIQQVSELTGLSAHSSGAYERIALIPPIARDEKGYRHYSQNDVGRINFLCCMIQTRMPLEQVRRYAELYAYGEESNGERGAILLQHRAEILRQIDDLTNALALVEKKLAKFHAHVEQEPVKEAP